MQGMMDAMMGGGKWSRPAKAHLKAIANLVPGRSESSRFNRPINPSSRLLPLRRKPAA